MVDINWKAFELKHPKATDAFETLCYFLFCRKYRLIEGVRTDFNQVGLETEPVKNAVNKYCGFQAKFFEKNINYTNIAESIDKALKNYDELDHIIIYINQPAQTSCKSAKDIEVNCEKRGVTVEWVLPANFTISLNQPNNLDLAEFYFEKTNVLKMLSDSKSIRINTLLQAKEYVELNLKNSDGVLTISEYCSVILKSSDKLHLITGDAGSGKSVCIRKLFNDYSGFAEESEEAQLKVIDKVGAVCKFISLNNSSVESLEKAFAADLVENKYIYLLDGLDEIPTESITVVLLLIESLIERDKTKKVIISSRLSSYNKFILKSTFTSVSEYTIADLSKGQIQQYFESKQNDDKKSRLLQLSEQNHDFYERITDVLTLSLLWEYIFDIKDTNFLSDLMEVSVSSILNDIHHKRYLDKLNLPNPKANAIIEINKALALYLFENDKYSLSQKELQNIISGAYPKCDYSAINELISYNSDLFFDVIMTENIQTFSYRHRRFSEYFTLLCIETIIQKDLGYLRKNNIIINYDLFERMLIPHLKNKAIRENDISLAFEVGMFNVYLGNDRAWGIDKEFYYWSRWIIYSIAELPDEILQNALEDKALPIRKFFHDVPQKIIHTLKDVEKPSRHDGFVQNYINLMLLIERIHKSGKEALLPELLSYYKTINELSKEKGYYFHSISNGDNYLVWRCLLYINTVIFEDNLNGYIEGALVAPEDINADDVFAEYISINTFYFSSLYYNTLLYHPDKCPDIIRKLKLNQLSFFALAASKPECMFEIFNNDSIKHSLRVVLEKQIDGEGCAIVLCLALKKLLDCSLTDTEMNLVKSYLGSNEFKSYSVFYKENCDTVGFILVAFGELIKPEKIDGEINRYLSAYTDYYSLLNGSSNISGFVRNIRRYLSGSSEANYHIKVLLGKALALFDANESSLKGAIDFLNDFMKEGGLLIIYHTMKSFSIVKFNNATSSSIINQLDNPNVYKDIDFTSTSDLLFMISFLISSYSGTHGYQLLLKGISNGMMRMNDRKDTIGDYKLLEGLEVILKNNWLSIEELVVYLERIVLIANNMNTYHIENDVHGKTMELLQKHNFAAAEFYYTKISKFEECYNSIHYDFAKDLVCRGRDVDDIENCLNNMRVTYDRYHQKLDRDTFYYKLSVYLHITSSDFYSTALQDEYFMKAQEEIDKLESAGWERELSSNEYEIYTELCAVRSKSVDVNKEREIEYSVTSTPKKNNTLEVLTAIDTEEKLTQFVNKLRRECNIDDFAINDMLINKSVELSGNIDNIIRVLSELNYPSNISYSTNSHNFWMTVVSALKNATTKSTVLDYLLNHGGGHDGFSEIIKIYGYLNNKDICLKTFDKMIDCIEFLLC